MTTFSPAHLRALRLAAGWKRPELGRRTGLAPATITSYENGTSAPSVAALGRLASALDCDIDALFDREPADAA